MVKTFKHKNGKGIEETALTMTEAVKLIMAACTVLSVGWGAAVFYYKGQIDILHDIEGQFKAADAEIVSRLAYDLHREVVRIDHDLEIHDTRIRNLETRK